MGRGGRTVVAAVLACLPAACAADAGGLTVAGLRCEWLVDPVGVVAREPRLSWRLESAARDQRQSAGSRMPIVHVATSLHGEAAPDPS